MRAGSSGMVVLRLALVGWLVTCALGAGPKRPSRGRVTAEFAEARQLFVRMYQPGETSPLGGDGLGPLYNEQSCVGCHHLGGIGGAGGNDRNVVILTATPSPVLEHCNALLKGELDELHPGLRTRSSIVLHRHAASAADQARLAAIRGYQAVQTREDFFVLSRSERSTPALFGAGLIDDIRDGDLLAAEKRRYAAFPEIRGRVSRLVDGRLGRFGWKGQTASLHDFVLGACANELGLEVPGHHQPSLVPSKDFKPASIRLDLDSDDCGRLTRFVASLPRPGIDRSAHPVAWTQGSRLFEAIGCAGCHSPSLGAVDGLYSDLLLHDLGDRIQSSGGYGSRSSGPVVDRTPASPGASGDAPEPTGDPTPTEWRTTPLWGVADSAPYLHDGRASTLDAAIRLHGGEAENTTQRYLRLNRLERQALVEFLRSLRAPRTAAQQLVARTQRPR